MQEILKVCSFGLLFWSSTTKVTDDNFCVQTIQIAETSESAIYQPTTSPKMCQESPKCLCSPLTVYNHSMLSNKHPNNSHIMPKAPVASSSKVLLPNPPHWHVSHTKPTTLLKMIYTKGAPSSNTSHKLLNDLTQTIANNCPKSVP